MTTVTRHSVRGEYVIVLRDHHLVAGCRRVRGATGQPDRMVGLGANGRKVVHALCFPSVRFTEAAARAYHARYHPATVFMVNLEENPSELPGLSPDSGKSTGGGSGGSVPGPDGTPLPTATGFGRVAGTIGLFTAPDVVNGHQHEVRSYDRETGIGVTECVGGFNSAIPLHAHPIVGDVVLAYKVGSYVSDHGGTPIEDAEAKEAAVAIAPAEGDDQ